MALAARAAALNPQSRELSARAVRQALERVRSQKRIDDSQEEDPLEREKSPPERLRRNSRIETQPLERPRGPLERPASGLPLFLSPRWAFLDGLNFYPRFHLSLLLFIDFILRILISLYLLWAFYLSLVLMGLILALGI